MKQNIKNILPAVMLCSLFWCCNRICTIPSELWMAKVVHSLGLYIFLDAVLLCGLYAISYEHLSWKVLFLFLLITTVCATLLYTGIQSYLAFNYTWEELATRYRANPDIAIENTLPGSKMILDLWQPFVLSMICFVHYKFSKLNAKYSDKPNNDNILIVFYYPKNWVGLLLTSFWKLPINTIKLYYKGFLYGFSKDEGKLIKEKVPQEELKECFIRDTKLNSSVEKILFGLVDVKWSVKRNCLNVFEPVVGKITNYI